jgi:hypothetical protein
MFFPVCETTVGSGRAGTRPKTARSFSMPQSLQTATLAFYVITATLMALGIAAYVYNQVRGTFFLPRVGEDIVFSEKYVLVRSNKMSWPMRAHVVVTPTMIWIVICRMFYKERQPAIVYEYRYPLRAAISVAEVQSDEFNTLLEVRIQSGVASWQFKLNQLPEFVRVTKHYLDLAKLGGQSLTGSP